MMSRSNYSDDLDNDWSLICWRGAVKSAIRGKRGQTFLKEMLTALDALPVKELIGDELATDEGVCAIGAVGKMRGLDMTGIDPEDSGRVAELFGIADAMAREIVYENDDYWRSETPKERYSRMRKWVESQLTPPHPINQPHQ
jgi:hypothetical protein